MPRLDFFLFLVFVVLFSFGLIRPVSGAIAGCTASVGPGSVQPNSTATLEFVVDNDDSANSITWVKITSPSGNFTITGGSAGGFSVSSQSGNITYTGGSIRPQDGLSFLVNVSTGGETPSSSWTVEVSDDGGGAGAVSCGGITSVSITSTPSGDTTPPVMSNVTVTDITPSSVKVNWNTDEAANSRIDYGTTVAYSLSKSDSALVTSHTLELTGLSSDTTYHFTIKSADASNNVGDFGDSTFKTTKPGQTSPGGPAPTPIPSTTTSTKKTQKDNSPPEIKTSTSFSKPFSKAPVISGNASDDTGVSKVEYSIDGKNWLPIAISKGTQVSFSFTPAIVEDGDYVIRIRAEDSAGNVSSISSFRLVIDQLPPQVGANIFSLGAQLLSPNEDGTLVTFEGLEQKVTLSAIGGPITIEIVAGENRYSLAKNVESGLWTSIINFPKQGRYEVRVEAIDGAGNKTERKLNPVVVLPAGKITWFFGKPIEGASVYVYYFEPTAGQFVLWDAKPFGQENPQKTDKEGRYAFFLPPGKYYLEVRAPAFRTTRSTIFTLDKSLPIDADFNLLPAGIRIGSLAITIPHTAISQRISLGEEIEVPKEAKREFVGQKIEDFTPSISLIGKKTILTFLNTWLPQASEQIVILDELFEEKKANLVVIVPQESEASVFIFKERGEYQVPMLADPQGKLVELFSLHSLPLNLFLDENGVIKEAKVGVLDRQELLNSLD